MTTQMVETVSNKGINIDSGILISIFINKDQEVSRFGLYLVYYKVST